MNRPAGSENAASGRSAPKSAPVNGNGRGSVPMTASQRRRFLGIAKCWDINVEYECRERFTSAFDDLSIREALDLIDHLKLSMPASTSRR
jgi:hypothetical protein